MIIMVPYRPLHLFQDILGLPVQLAVRNYPPLLPVLFSFF